MGLGTHRSAGLRVHTLRNIDVMKRLFNQKKQMALRDREIGAELDREIEERWGFHYSQTDDDEIIDTLDHGTSSLTYAEFVEKMDAYAADVASHRTTLRP